MSGICKYSDIFLEIFKRVVGHEGGYQCNAKDPGNWTGGKVGSGELKGTKYGLSAHSYPNLDIKNITLEEAKLEYYNWYKISGIIKFCNPMKYQLFDAAFNHGQNWANRFLQRAVGVTDDGIIGRVTMSAVSSCDVEFVLIKFIAVRTKFFTDLSTYDEFGRGWMRRIATNLHYGAEDIKRYKKQHEY